MRAFSGQWLVGSVLLATICFSPALAGFEVSLTVERGPLPGEVALQWGGGQPTFGVYSSIDPLDVVVVSNLLGDTSTTTWIDLPTDPLVFYQVVGLSCGEDPTPPGGIHFVTCGPQECTGSTIVCPSGSACQVSCTNFRSCAGATIVCPENYSCHVNCDGDSSCDGAAIRCALGVCTVFCGSGNEACRGNLVECGADACSAECASQSKPNVICGDACLCEPCP